MYKKLELPDATAVIDFLNRDQREGSGLPIPPPHVISVIWKSSNLIANGAGYYEVVYWDQTDPSNKGR